MRFYSGSADVQKFDTKPCFCFFIIGCKRSDVFVFEKYGESDLESFTENKIFYILNSWFVSVTEMLNRQHRLEHEVVFVCK